MWVRSSTRGIRRDEVSMSRFSFSHLHSCIGSSSIRNSCLRVSSSIIMGEQFASLCGWPSRLHYFALLGITRLLHEYVDSCARRVEGKPKFKYLFPLDDEIAGRKMLSKTYRKMRATSETSDRPGVHPGEGRAARTMGSRHWLRQARIEEEIN